MHLNGRKKGICKKTHSYLLLGEKNYKKDNKNLNRLVTGDKWGRSGNK